MSRLELDLGLVLLTVLVSVLAINADRQLRSLRRAFQNVLDRDVLDALRSQAARTVDDQLPVLIVVPAYNEAASIGHVLRRLPTTIDGVPVRPVVLVDGGEDGTENEARKAGAWVARSLVNRGQGAMILLGFAFAQAVGCRVVVTMDADGQHDPQYLPDLVRPILRGEADMVIGSRNQDEIHATSRMRHYGMVFLNALLRMLGVSVTDCSSGFRAYHPTALPRLRTQDPQYSGGELLVLAARNRLRILETPVEMHRRIEGVSKKGSDMRFAVRFTSAMLRATLRPVAARAHARPLPRLNALTKEEDS